MENKILGLRTAIYQVGDIAAAKRWYAEAFGKQPYFDEPFYVGFDIGGFELGLQPQVATATKAESVDAYWGVVDINCEVARFVKLGASEYESPKDVGGGIQVAKVRDPWDNIIGLIYNPHFKAS